VSRHRSGSSYSHAVMPVGYPGEYWISWKVDYYYVGSRQRFPRSFRRVTDLDGAAAFCRRWDVPMPGLLRDEIVRAGLGVVNA